MGAEKLFLQRLDCRCLGLHDVHTLAHIKTERSIGVEGLSLDTFPDKVSVQVEYLGGFEPVVRKVCADALDGGTASTSGSHNLCNVDALVVAVERELRGTERCSSRVDFVIQRDGYLIPGACGGGVAVLNFFLMGLTVQKALNKDEKEAAAMMKFSQTYRLLLIAAAAGVGALVPVFNVFAVIIPLFFPRIAIAIRPFVGIKYSDAEAKDTNE